MAAIKNMIDKFSSCGIVDGGNGTVIDNGGGSGIVIDGGGGEIIDPIVDPCGNDDEEYDDEEFEEEEFDEEEE